MRIAILADPLDNQTAGVHVYTRELLQALVALSDSRHTYLLIRQKKTNDFPQLQQVVVPVLPWLPGWATFRLFFLVPLYCRRLKVDAVFEPGHFGPFNLPAGIRRITMIHDLTPIHFPHYHRWHSQWLQRRFLPGILRRADLVVTNSNYTRQDVVAYQPAVAEKTIAIPLGISPTMRHTTMAVPKKYALPMRYFLFVGTLEPRKNLLTLLSGYTTYRNNGGTAALVLAGKMGWHTSALQKALDQHPYRSDIWLPGFVDDADLPVLYSNALAFIYPSEYEGFGFPVLEAMACKTPVIAAANSSLLEIGGSHAYFFPTKEVPALAALMQQEEDLLDDQRIEAAHAHALTYSWTSCARQFELTLSEM